MDVAYFSDQGLVRSRNEDSIFVDESRGLFIVADGMGGHLGGEVASDMAVRIVRDHLLDADPVNEDRIETALQQANREVYGLSTQQAELSGMGTTLSVASVGQGHLVYGHVGDSRIYLVRDGQMSRVTRDHTMVEELVEQGAISAEEARHHPRKNVLVRALGTDQHLPVDRGTVPLQAGDTVVLMTDGVYGYLEDRDILGVLDTMPLQEAVRTIMQQVMDRGASDNLTMIAFQVEAGWLK